jgi:carbon storage regulator CsrA
MLVLSRRLNEKIVIPSVKASIQIVAVRAGSVRLGIEAPPDVTILREEVCSPTDQFPAPGSDKNAASRLAHLEDVLRSRLPNVARGMASLRQNVQGSRLPDLQNSVDQMDNAIQALCEQLGMVLNEPVADTPVTVAPGR